MSHHEGVSCDSCLRSNFRGKRYKCLLCFDYDLCAACHDSGSLSGSHLNEHPMQCILTRSDLDLYFAGEILTNDQPHSFTCPLCGKLGFTDSTLYEHVNSAHNEASAEVVCPICATLPGGEQNQVTDDFLTHLNIEHRNNRDLEEPQVVRIRSRHHVRLNNNRNRRSQFFNSNGASTTRDTIDPIAQLLSQLSDVRRINNSTNGQNLMQFNFDRQSNSNRLPLERLIHRQRRQNSHISSGNSTQQDSASNQQMPYMVLLDSTTSPNTNVNSLLKSSSTGGSQVNKINTQFLLSSCSVAALCETEQLKLNRLKADRSIFLQEIIFASLSQSINITKILSEKSISIEKSKLAINNSSNGDTNKIDSDKPISKDTRENINVENYCLVNERNNKDNFKQNEMTSLTKQRASKCIDNNVTSSSSFNYNDNVQQKSLPSLISNGTNSTFILPQTAALNHRNRSNKARSTSAITSSANLAPNLASITLRSSLTAGPGTTISVVSPNGRRKVLKHPTEPPPN